MTGLLVSSSLIPHPSSRSWAAHPFRTDDTGTQGAGKWRLELIRAETATVLLAGATFRW